jgi:hypothetical protein
MIDLSQNRKYGLRLQKDTWLALVIERPVQAAGVEIKKHSKPNLGAWA